MSKCKVTIEVTKKYAIKYETNNLDDIQEKCAELKRMHSTDGAEVDVVATFVSIK